MLVAETASTGRAVKPGLPSLGDANVFEIMSRRTDFSAVLRDSIEEGMKSVLGNGGAQAIFYHLDLPSFDNPKRFHEKLSAIFGVGTAALERVIIQRLHQNLGFRPAPTKEGDFVIEVELARSSFDASATRKGERKETEA
jgi:hypothetical protein